MSERLRQGFSRAKEGARNASFATANCIIEQAPAGYATAMGALGGAELSAGNTGGAIVDFALATGGIILNQRLNSRRQRQMFAAGFQGGAMASEMMEPGGLMQVIDFGIEGQNGERAPLYQSLDGNTTITSPHDLLEEFGDPRRGSIRVSKIVRDSKNRDLTPSEVETLRRAEATMSILPGFEQTLCDRGQTIATDMHTLVQTAEEKYRDENPTIIDAPQEDP